MAKARATKARHKSTAPSPKPGTATYKAGDTRRAVRFAIMQRVDYDLGGHATFDYSSDLSASGLFIRGADKLKVGQQLTIKIHLKNQAEPVTIRAIVRRLSADGVEPGAGLEFAPGQDKAIAQIRRFIEDELIAKLESTVKRSLVNANGLALLGSYYVEAGKVEDALALFRRGIDANPANQLLYEALTRSLLPEIRQRGVEGWTTLVEIEKLLERGLALGPSPCLMAMREEAKELRAQIDRRNRERAREEEERKHKEEREREAQQRETVLKEARAQVEKELSARRQELERSFTEKLELAQKELNDQRRSQKQRQSELDALAASIKEQETKLGRVQQKADQKLARIEESAAAAHADVAKQKDAATTLQHELREREKSLAAREADLTAGARDITERQRARERELTKQERDLVRQREALGELEALHATLKDTRAELAQSKRKTRDAEAERDEQISLLRAKERALAQTDKTLTEAQSARAALETTVAELRAELRNTRKKLAETGENQSELETQLASLRAELEARVASAGETAAMADGLVDERARIEAETQRLAIAGRSLEEDRAVLCQEREELARLRINVETEGERLIVARTDLDKERQDWEVIRAQIDSEQQALARSHRELTDDLASIAEERRVLADERAELTQAQQRLLIATADLDSTTSEQTRLRADLDRKRSDLDAERWSAQAERARIEAAENDLRLAEGELLRAREALDKDADHLLGDRAAIAELERRVDAVRNAQVIGQHEIDERREQLDIAVRGLEQKAKDLETRRLCMEAQQREHEATQQAFVLKQAELEAAHHHEEELQEEIKRETQLRGELELRLDLVHSELAAAHTQLAASRTTVSRADARASTAENPESARIPEDDELELLDDGSVVALVSVDQDPQAVVTSADETQPRRTPETTKHHRHQRR